jgi:hypothetical protein
MSSKTIYRDQHVVESKIRLPYADRIRLLFGATLYVDTYIQLPWRTQIDAKNAVAIEKVFATFVFRAKRLIFRNA